MAWDIANHACRATWFSLRNLGQIDTLFGESGATKMNQLSFWKQGSADMHELVAKPIAVSLDSVFTNANSAGYEGGKTQPDSIDAMAEILATGDKTLDDLATVVDAHYLFSSEVPSEIG